MDYRVIAKDELKKIKHYRAAKDVIESRISELQEMIVSGKVVGEELLSCIAMREDEKKHLGDVKRALKRFYSAFNTLTNDEKHIIELAFVQQKRIEEIIDIEHLSRATVFRRQEDALVSFTRAYFGAVVT